MDPDRRAVSDRLQRSIECAQDHAPRGFCDHLMEDSVHLEEPRPVIKISPYALDRSSQGPQGLRIDTLSRTSSHHRLECYSGLDDIKK